MGNLRWRPASGRRLVCILAAVAATASCTSSPQTGIGGGTGTRAQPSSAAYRCDGGETLRIENQRSSVTVVKSDGTRIDLPASPPGSRVRYGEPPYALVFDGRELLYFQTGKTPLSCRR